MSEEQLQLIIEQQKIIIKQQKMILKLLAKPEEDNIKTKCMATEEEQNRLLEKFYKNKRK